MVGIENCIHVIRGQKVMLDEDLASLYGIEVRILIQAVKRNCNRFPGDFMFQLTGNESQALRSQIVISKPGRGGRRYLPFVFTEQGVAMLSSVLNSPWAIQVNIQIMRAFVKLRKLMTTHTDLARKIEALESRYDGQFHAVFEAIRRLLTPPTPKKRRIGFITENSRKEVSHAAR